LDTLIIIWIFQFSDILVLVVVGVVVGLVAFLVGFGLILFLVLFVKKRRKEQKISFNSTEKQKQQDQNENPQNGKFSTLKSNEDDVTHYLSLPSVRVDQQSRQLQQQKEQEKQPETESSSKTNSEITRKHQISFSSLEVEKEIGKGSYGKVSLGKWNGALVALKFCKEKEGFDSFLKEAALMTELPPHPNVVQMYGVSIDGPQPILVLEYCARGSLDKLLSEKARHLSENDKLDFVKGIARGMFHLHYHNIVHRDLAARNILLNEANVPKISDFGMSRIIKKDEEGETKNDIGPIRWMSPEAIGKRKYSQKSDVWSFGIVVWEIVSQGELFIDMDLFDIGVQIRDKGLTPKIPEDCPPLLREIMELCWRQQPEERPTFHEICKVLDNK
jgi:predicted Ser/Thr protein kinase